MKELTPVQRLYWQFQKLKKLAKSRDAALQIVEEVFDDLRKSLSKPEFEAVALGVAMPVPEVPGCRWPEYKMLPPQEIDRLLELVPSGGTELRSFLRFIRSIMVKGSLPMPADDPARPSAPAGVPEDLLPPSVLAA